ncbi:hypothetical protein X777_06218 [Ooceraea biroi]|uniref:Uncharacterized protein n=1 Tax=Ooceraea biroi TaxID=2015173 RepID=A0A026WAR7_OOCBI|nr:hypothetical protein X777_06218 [Ooceraea biroi]
MRNHKVFFKNLKILSDVRKHKSIKRPAVSERYYLSMNRFTLRLYRFPICKKVRPKQIGVQCVNHEPEQFLP